MIYIALNAPQILAATLAGLAFGALYHAVLGHADGAFRRSPLLVPLAALAELWLAAILAGALILAPSQAGAWTMALGSAVIIWIGFVMPALVVTLRYRGVATRTALLDCGHWLGVMLIQAAVLHALGLTAPPA